MKHGSLFSGIGGFDLAAEWMGWENVFHCEWMEFPRKVLDYYWPDADSLTDITKTNFKKYANKIDVLTGGFPCQPYSSAGKRKGKEDERHLWPEMLRAIREIKPSYVVGENVFGLLNWNGGLVFDEVHTDLESEGYEVQAVVIPAAAVNAPHGRDRVWFVAYRNGNLFNERNFHNEKHSSKGGVNAQRDAKQSDVDGDATNTLHKGLQGGQKVNGWQKHNNEWRKDRFNIGTIGKNFSTNTKCDFFNFPTQPPICSGNDGFSNRLDGITFPKWRAEPIKGYGNAIVPQVAYQIFRAIEQTI